MGLGASLLFAASVGQGQIGEAQLGGGPCLGKAGGDGSHALDAVTSHAEDRLDHLLGVHACRGREVGEALLVGGLGECASLEGAADTVGHEFQGAVGLLGHTQLGVGGGGEGLHIRARLHAPGGDAPVGVVAEVVGLVDLPLDSAHAVK